MPDIPTFPDKGYAEKFSQRRVCSRCYGDLTIAPLQSERKWIATCHTCGDAWGFTTVSRSYAERLGQRALAERAEVKKNLSDLFPNPHKGRDKDDLIKDLGFE